MGIQNPTAYGNTDNGTNRRNGGYRRTTLYVSSRLVPYEYLRFPYRNIDPDPIGLGQEQSRDILFALHRLITAEVMVLA